jgi:WD40 repeat protein
LYGAFPAAATLPQPLTVRSVAGEQMTRTVTSEREAPDDNWVFSGWITDTLLLVHRVDTALNVAYPYTVALYDPVGDDWRNELLAELPDRHPTGAVAIAPDLTRALYVAEAGNDFSLVLWDLSAHREVWRRDGFSAQSVIEGTRVGAFPVAWSADSARVAFLDWGNLANQYEAQTFILDRDGQAAEAIVTPRPNDFVAGMAWSPDGRYVAGVTSLKTSTPENIIVVYDTVTHVGTDLCALPGEDNPLSGLPGARVVWSPDSRYVAYQGGADSATGGVVVENIFTGVVAVVARGAGATLIGWSPGVK